MRMSDLTVCPATPYKTPGFHFNQSAFDEETYTFDEIFHNKTVESIAQKVNTGLTILNLSNVLHKLSFQDFSIKEFHSHAHGRCFVLSSEHKFTSPSETIELYFKKDGPGAVLYAHEPEAEFLISLDTFIPGAKIEYEEIKGDPLACLIELEVEKKYLNYIHTKKTYYT